MFYNEDFERMILASILFEPEKLIEIRNKLHGQHFYTHQYKEIYKAMLQLEDDGLPAEESYINQKTDKKFEQNLVEIMMSNPMSNVLPYIVDVIEMSNKRNLLKYLDQFKIDLTDGKETDVLISQIVTQVSSLEQMAELPGQTFSAYKAEYLSRPPSLQYSTGVNFLDHSLKGGIKMGQLVLLSGDPEAGKTMLAMQILKNITKVHQAVIYAFEFTVDALVSLQLSIEGDNYENENLHIVNDGYDIFDIERSIKSYVKNGAKFFTIDSQMRIENSSNKGTMEERESEKFSKLAKLAHQLDIVIVLIIQNSKADAAAGSIGPMGTKKGAHEASIIMHLKRILDDTKNKGLREFVMHKNKQTGEHFKCLVKLNHKDKVFEKYVL